MKLNHNVIIHFVLFDFFSVHFHNDFLLAILAKCQALGATPGVLSKLILQDDHTFLGNCPATPSLLKKKANIITYFSLRAKCWLGGGVGGQFPRNIIIMIHVI